MPKKDHRRNPKTPWGQIAILAGVAILIVGVLIAKNQSQPAANPVGATGQAQSTLALPALQPPGLGTGGRASVATPTTLPEVQLDQLLAEKRPTLAFFHSNTCQQCIQMTQIVQQVYPEFAGSVALVDVNVYDERNTKLLQRARISVIPTLVFINREGKSQVTTGVMQPAQLRLVLQSLSGS